VFAAVLATQLRDDGYWSLDDPLVKFFPDFAPYTPSKAARPVTLRSLAAHTSGLPRANPCPGCGESQILQKLSNHYSLYAPWGEVQYSNLGISFLGRAAEKVVPGQLQ
jgi:CubicO group peptidase (beta-lactamase class C family)